jgi:hypothetical protein
MNSYIFRLLLIVFLSMRHLSFSVSALAVYVPALAVATHQHTDCAPRASHPLT